MNAQIAADEEKLSAYNDRGPAKLKQIGEAANPLRDADLDCGFRGGDSSRKGGGQQVDRYVANVLFIRLDYIYLFLSVKFDLFIVVQHQNIFV